MSVPTPSRDLPAAPRERRNFRTRALFPLARRGGPFRYWPLAITVLGLIGLAVGIWRVTSAPALDIPEVPYSLVASAITRGHVSEVVVNENGARLVVTLSTPYTANGREVRTIETSVPSRAVSLLDLERWSSTGAKVQVTETGGSKRELFIQILSVVTMIAVVTFVLARQRAGIGGAKFSPTPEARQLTLADVGGAREAQADLRDVIAYLKDPERFRVMGAKCPKGVLLIGPPGTGKTLLARAVAGEAGCPVITCAGSDFNEMYVGVGSRRVRQLAKQARERAPCIVFIDEFDSLGGRRGRPNRSGEEEVTLNQLLVEMDGMGGSEGVVWMAATNREDMLDPAVRRPGRFDRVVEVPLPTANDRLEILKIHAARSPLAPDVDLERLSLLTVGHSGAELANLLNEAAIIAVQDGSDLIANRHIEQARDKILLGRVRSGVVVTDEERRLIALHESGHAIVGMIACPDDKLHKVTIEPRGRSMGAAHFAPEQDRHVHPRHYLEGLVAKALGGRAAELIFLGPDAITTGAGADLVQATSVARRMVGEFGMSEEVGLISTEPMAHGGQPSAQLQAQVDSAAKALITRQASRAEALVREHRAAVEAVANALLERDVLTADEVYKIAAEHGVAAARPHVRQVVGAA
ncbi:MAG TPA: AAA family ATPase [Gemmatimonadaceae bacterium]|nr:AAA family ATPase [Gemmatimonadaceae bacterium]